MKKVIVLLIVFTCFTSFASCTSKNEESQAKNESEISTGAESSSQEKAVSDSSISDESKTVSSNQSIVSDTTSADKNNISETDRKIIDDMYSKYLIWCNIVRGELANDENDKVNIDYEDGCKTYCKVTDKDFKTADDIKAFLKTYLVPENAEATYNQLLSEERGDYYIESNGYLFINYNLGAREYPEDWQPENATVTYTNDSTLTVNIPYTCFDEPVEIWKVEMKCIDGIWLVYENGMA